MLVFRSRYTVKHQQGSNFALLILISSVLRIVPGTCSENIVEYRMEIHIGSEAYCCCFVLSICIYMKNAYIQ